MKKRSRILRSIGYGVLGIFLLVYIVLPVGIAAVVLFPAGAEVGPPPAGFEKVELEAEDGVRLNAWYAPPTNGAAVILLHGAGGSRETVRPYAGMLVHRGYGVLALDLRGHGESSGNTNRLGWLGTQDVGAAVRFLQGRDENVTIGGLGLSLGGEVLLAASADYPEMAAIAADGATHRCTEEVLALPSERPVYRSFNARLMYAAVELFSGETPPEPLLQAMLDARSTAFLLIAAGTNEMEVRYNQRFAGAVGARAAIWTAQDAAHMGAFARYPEEYEQRLNRFFDEALLGR